MEKEDNSLGESRRHFLASIERFMVELQGRLAETPRGKLTESKELRMLLSIVMRSFDIWARALAAGGRDESAVEKLQHLKRTFLETAGGVD